MSALSTIRVASQSTFRRLSPKVIKNAITLENQKGFHNFRIERLTRSVFFFGNTLIVCFIIVDLDAPGDVIDDADRKPETSESKSTNSSAAMSTLILNFLLNFCRSLCRALIVFLQPRHQSSRIDHSYHSRLSQLIHLKCQTS